MLRGCYIVDVCVCKRELEPLPPSFHPEKRTSSQRELSAQSRYAITLTLTKTYILNLERV